MDRTAPEDRLARPEQAQQKQMASAILGAKRDGLRRIMPLHAGSAPLAVGGKYLNQSCFRSCHSAKSTERMTPERTHFPWVYHSIVYQTDLSELHDYLRRLVRPSLPLRRQSRAASDQSAAGLPRKLATTIGHPRGCRPSFGGNVANSVDVDQRQAVVRRFAYDGPAKL